MGAMGTLVATDPDAGAGAAEEGGEVWVVDVLATGAIPGGRDAAADGARLAGSFLVGSAVRREARAQGVLTVRLHHCLRKCNQL